MTTTEIPCRFCSKSGGVIRHGYSPNGFQRFRCLDCQRTFQLDYCYEAYRPCIMNNIVEMVSANYGVGKTGCHLKVACNTVLKNIKTSGKQ
ncbi:IS1 family transposase [Aeromonas media]|uniref:IS1 family transposase n=1 Tax=Aeromonas media TaxID=651 RepID=UPI003873AA93